MSTITHMVEKSLLTQTTTLADCIVVALTSAGAFFLVFPQVFATPAETSSISSSSASYVKVSGFPSLS